ncbi:hypothetical protein FQA39_LY10336 [Lamprigera yunnana]|nr:hypothetical protein FQA39_LY10336 [Lamprigera yunnana]
MEVSDFPTIDPSCDYEKISPILQKRVVVFINHFVTNTVSFLNTFAQSCESRLLEFEYKLRKVEASLLILESQLSSISGLDNSANGTRMNDTLDLPEVETEEETEHLTQATEDPRFTKFFKMLQFGVPLQAVKNKMTSEGLDSSILDKPNNVVPGKLEDSS